MKNLMITTAAAALLFGAAACSQSENTQYGETDFGTPAGENIEMADAETTTDMDPGLLTDDSNMPVEIETVYLASGQVSADEMIGADIVGTEGERLATIDDFLLADDGRVESVIFREGDIASLVGAKGAIGYDQLALTMSPNMEQRFKVEMSEAALENVIKFEQEGLNDYRLASEIIGTPAEFADTDESVRINDLIMTADGEVMYAIVSDPVDASVERQLAFADVTVEQGDGGALVINTAYDEFESAPFFKYERDIAKPSGVIPSEMDAAEMDAVEADAEEETVEKY